MRTQLAPHNWPFTTHKPLLCAPNKSAIVKYLFLLVCCFRTCLLVAQNDTTLLLSPERLTEKDIVFHDLSLQPTRVISATRSVEEVDQMPFSIWVATADDIQRNGYITLGDVLRAAPGIRVSQPGNALEGETFLMRGLAGNQFVKILINDIPIKPYVTPGMPIGAQLPIRQAERIEVIYGPAGVLYGNEACAGVVNIILKESERPVYAQADLSFGQFGRNNLDVTFGGKLGKDKKIFRFSLYGSSTVRDRTDIYGDQAIYNVDTYVPNYAPSSFYTNYPNYKRSDAVNFSKSSPIPHESRLFGVNLKWRGLQFSYLRMARFDHNSLGLNPLAASYANASNQLAENQEMYTLSFQRQRKRWVTYNNVSVLHYRINNTTTSSYLYDRLAASSYLIQSAAFPGTVNLLDSVYRRYNSEERYGYARGLDVRYETRINASLTSNLSLDLGAQFNIGNGFSYFGHHLTPVETGLLEPVINSEPLSPESYTGSDINMLSQLKWQNKSLTVIGGLALNTYLGEVFTATTLPRLAAQYRIAKRWVVRGNYSTGVRHISPYYSTNTFYINPQDGTLSRTTVSALDNSEFSRAFEAAVRYENLTRFEAIFFKQQTSNIIRPNQTRLLENGEWLYGYQNIPGKGMSLWGVQGILRSEVIKLGVMNNLTTRRKSEITSRLEFFIQYARGKEWLEEGAMPLSEVMNQPRWHTQFRTFFRLGRVEIIMASNRQTSVLSKSVSYRDAYQLQFTQERYPVFRTWDMGLRLYFNKQFVVYLHFQNVFNRQFTGLDATGTPDDLRYNLQQGRFFRFGANYNLN